MRRPISLGYRFGLSVILSSLLAGAGGALSEPGRTKEPLVLVEVVPDSPFARAGLRVGDQLVAWRPAAPPDSAGELATRLGTSHPFESYTDWLWLSVDRSRRGPVLLLCRTAGDEQWMAVEGGPWPDRVRPVVSPGALVEILRARSLESIGEKGRALEIWDQLLNASGPDGSVAEPGLQTWLVLQALALEIDRGTPEIARQRIEAWLSSPGDPNLRRLQWHRVMELFPWRDAPEAAAWAAEHLLTPANSTSGSEDRGWEESGQESSIDLPRITLLIADAHFVRGMVAASRSDWVAARLDLEQARDLLELLSPGSRALAWVLGELGSLAEIRNDLAQAEHLLSAALDIWRHLGELGTPRVVTLQMLGMVSWRRGELTLAEDYHLEALRLLRRQPVETVKYASGLHHLAWVAEKRGELDRARDLLVEALEIKTRLAPGSHTLAYTLATLADVENQLGHHDRAVDLAQEAHTLRREIAPDSREVMFSLELMARLATTAGAHARAEEYLLEALALARRWTPGTANEVRLLFDLGSTERSLGRPGLGEVRLRRAMALLEDVVHRVDGSHDAVALYRQQFRTEVRLLVDLLAEQGRVSEAFEAQEQIRAVSFLALVSDRENRQSRRLAEEGLQALRRATEERWRLESRLALDGQESERRSLRWSVRQLDRRRADLLQELARGPRASSSSPDAITSPATLDLAAAQGRLAPGTLMLSFTVGESSTQLILVPAKGAAQIHTLPVGEPELRSGVTELRRLILDGANPASPRVRDLVSQGRSLGRRLFGPVAAQLVRAERLVVIPDEPLHALPFGALYLASAEREGGPDDLPLAALLPFVVARSATAQARWDMRAPGEGGAELVALADPTTPRATDLGNGGGRRRADVLGACRPAEHRLTLPLPGARDEALRIAPLAPARRRWLRLGAEATEGELRRLAPRARWLHLALHAELDAVSPLDSALHLACPDGPVEGRDDGLLRAWEILEQLVLDAELVVLSACSSGLGDEVGGEGLQGLSRAFQIAGARAVLASLWPVDDQGTRELMERFYRHLGRGVRKDEALHRAQKELLAGDPDDPEAPDYSHPWYWAAFQIWGEGR